MGIGQTPVKTKYNYTRCIFLIISAAFLLFIKGGTYGVRLRGTTDKNRGRVEIYHPSYGWSTACDDTWDTNDGQVVCRQLGYSGVSAVHHNAYYGQGYSSYILHEHPHCNGWESHIWDCSTGHSRWNTGCGHSDDVGVDCY